MVSLCQVSWSCQGGRLQLVFRPTWLCRILGFAFVVRRISSARRKQGHHIHVASDCGYFPHSHLLGWTGHRFDQAEFLDHQVAASWFIGARCGRRCQRNRHSSGLQWFSGPSKLRLEYSNMSCWLVKKNRRIVFFSQMDRLTMVNHIWTPSSFQTFWGVQ